MKKTNVSINSIVEYQLPEFVRIEFPLLVEFLKEYYRYTDTSYGPTDLIRNIQDYIKLDNLTNLEDVFQLYNPPNDIELIEKSNNTIINGEKLIKVTTSSSHNLVDGEFVTLKNVGDENIDDISYKVTVEDPVSYTHLTLPTNREV